MLTADLLLTNWHCGAPEGSQSSAYWHPTYARKMLVDLSWASSHLEGNSYSRLDTRRLIEHGRAASGKAAFETQMILNHKAAIEFLVENLDRARVDRFTLLNLHATLAENLLADESNEGRLRRHPVGIGQSAYTPPSIPQQLEETLDRLLDKARRIDDPFEQSFFLFVHLPYLQPFADVNKRTARLAANLPLFHARLCPLTFIGVPADSYQRAMLGVYELNRNPDQYAMLRANPALIPAMVSESIRYQTPLAHMARTALRDVEVGGKTIREGDRVAMWYISGNRDETVIDNPDVYIIDRERSRQHMSFGFGVHRCVGNRVAEMQLTIIWEEILKRFPVIKLVEEPVRSFSSCSQ